MYDLPFNIVEVSPDGKTARVHWLYMADKFRLSLNDYKAKHWRTIKIVYDAIKTEAALAIKTLDWPAFQWIEITVYHNTRYDMDNLPGTIKPIVDQFRKAEIIRDDDRRYWTALHIIYEPTLPKQAMLFEVYGEII